MPSMYFFRLTITATAMVAPTTTLAMVVLPILLQMAMSTRSDVGLECGPASGSSAGDKWIILGIWPSRELGSRLCVHDHDRLGNR